MRDSRVDALAKILVSYSTRVGEGDTCLIEGSSAAEPLLAAVYEQVIEAGGQPVMSMSLADQASAFYSRASDAQLDWISPLQQWAAEEADCRIVIGADVNTRELSQLDPARQMRRQAATKGLMEQTLKRAAEGKHRWVYTLYPTNAYASDAEMSMRAFEDFYFRACLADPAEFGDPLTAWRDASEECRRLSDWIEGHEQVRVVAEGTDITLGIAGRTFIPCDGEHNMPDGEFFTGPIEDSVEGVVSFSLPAMVGGREVAGVRLRFESGRCVDASAERGEEFLIGLLDTDDGARRLGELGIGTNYGIDRGTRDVLLDEKIGGTVHMAVGASYPESGGTNDSAVHTDLVCDLRQGGRIEVDGETMQEDGRFVV
ncbi:aminopeptidase [Thermoleophilia bacterium SCSIO 60948]|nr:aminopeptidase [Thermoleophilia bacterium SCSIO 60948]